MGKRRTAGGGYRAVPLRVAWTISIFKSILQNNCKENRWIITNRKSNASFCSAVS